MCCCDVMVCLAIAYKFCNSHEKHCWVKTKWILHVSPHPHTHFKSSELLAVCQNWTSTIVWRLSGDKNETRASLFFLKKDSSEQLMEFTITIYNKGICTDKRCFLKECSETFNSIIRANQSFKMQCCLQCYHLLKMMRENWLHWSFEPIRGLCSVTLKEGL